MSTDSGIDNVMAAANWSDMAFVGDETVASVPRPFRLASRHTIMQVARLFSITCTDFPSHLQDAGSEVPGCKYTHTHIHNLSSLLSRALSDSRRALLLQEAEERSHQMFDERATAIEDAGFAAVVASTRTICLQILANSV